jgi:hypothetical protein
MILAGSLAVAAGTVHATGLPDDHLKCHKAKDSAEKAIYTADLQSVQPGFPNATGCEVKVPAKLVCTPVEKTAVMPPPPGAPTGVTLVEEFACYKLKCPKGEFEVPIIDQFGSRTVTVKAPKLLCTPANVPS